MVCVKEVSTPVRANLNSQYVATQQIFEFKVPGNSTLKLSHEQQYVVL